MRAQSIAEALLASLLLGACASAPREPPSLARNSTPKRIPAGAAAQVRLNTAVGTTESSPGQYITATLATPLMNERGEGVVPAGALLTGRVVAVQRGPAAAIELLWTTIDAGMGPAPLHATVGPPVPGAASVAPFSSREVFAEHLPYSAVLLPPRSAGSLVGGGPTEVDLPAGTAIPIVLTSPLEYPTPYVTHSRPAQSP